MNLTQNEHLRVKLTSIGNDVSTLNAFVETLSPIELRELVYDWEVWARPEQLAPDDPWTIWLLMAGRGFGKTRTGAEWVIREIYSRRKHRIALVAEDAADARDVMIEGESGIVSISPPWFKPKYEPSKKRITWPNGAVASIYSDQDPEALRGPQFDGAWCDELAKYKNSKKTWSNLMFGLRLGINPQCLVTTTPRPVPIIQELSKREDVVITRGTTYDNFANLSPVFYREIVTEYEGTTLGRQELDGELINPEEAGVIRRSWFKLWPKDKPLPKLSYVIQSYDTAFTDATFDTDTQESDPTACITFGVFAGPRGPSAIILDAWGEQMGYPLLRVKMRNDFRDLIYGPEDVERHCDLVLVEKKGSGISILQDLALANVPAKSYDPTKKGDKLQRLHAVSHLVQSGLVYVPESLQKKLAGKPCAWCEPALNEICSFPLSEHDDYVDAFSQALVTLRDMKMLRVVVRGDEYEPPPRVRKPRSNPYDH